MDEVEKLSWYPKNIACEYIHEIFWECIFKIVSNSINATENKNYILHPTIDRDLVWTSINSGFEKQFVVESWPNLYYNIISRFEWSSSSSGKANQFLRENFCLDFVIQIFSENIKIQNKRTKIAWALFSSHFHYPNYNEYMK